MEWDFWCLNKWIVSGCNKTEGLKVIKLRCCLPDNTDLPIQIFLLKNLKHLDCSGCFLKDFPSKIGNLRKLIYFDCSYNQLKSLPPDIGNLKKLQHLDCSYNELETLPSEIKFCKKLQHLKCNLNHLTTFPNIDKLSDLIHFDCSTNDLTVFPNIEKLLNLRHLDCSRNHLTVLPKIGILINLYYFDCSYNLIEYLPNNFEKQQNLEIFNFAGINLKCLPKNFTKLKNLVSVRRSHNFRQLTKEEIIFMCSKTGEQLPEKNNLDIIIKDLNYSRRKNTIIFAKSIENENSNISSVFRNLLRVICEFI